MKIAKTTSGAYRKESAVDNINKTLTFAHKSTAGGETSINLAALVLPTELSSYGFTNPSAQEIADAKLLFYKRNLLLFRSVGGALIPYLAYTVTSSTTITLASATSVNEIIYGAIFFTQKDGALAVDGRKILATGTLAANATLINVGDSFKVNAYPSQQLGEVLLILDGVAQMRNVGNATYAPTADGNYQEIDSGTGYATILQVNVPMAYDRSFMVMGTGIIVQRPDGSRDTLIETLSAQMELIVGVLADVSGQPTSYFRAAPNYPQLSAYASMVTSLVPYIASFSTNVTGAGGTNKHETYKMDATSGDLSVTFATPASSNKGNFVYVKKMDVTANWVTMSGTFDETVVLQNQSDVTCFQSDGSTWIKVA